VGWLRSNSGRMSVRGPSCSSVTAGRSSDPIRSNCLQELSGALGCRLTRR
jgi:hypothetical protein